MIATTLRTSDAERPGGPALLVAEDQRHDQQQDGGREGEQAGEIERPGGAPACRSAGIRYDATSRTMPIGTLTRKTGRQPVPSDVGADEHAAQHLADEAAEGQGGRPEAERLGSGRPR